MYKKLLLLTPFIAGLLFNSCMDDDFGGMNLSPVSVTAHVKFGGDFVTDKNAVNANVIFRNVDTGVEYIGVTDANGNYVLPAVLPGKYSATVNFTLTPTQFEEYFGYDSGSDEYIVFNGVTQNIDILSSGTTITVEIFSANTIGGLVIKQVYYAGSHTTRAASFRDQFVEIYNNSAEVIYADGLIFAQLFGNNTVGTDPFHLPSGQLNWAMSEGNTKGNAANTDYVYADAVYRIPGSGQQYPIQPGESITIAATAINHKSNYTDNNGNSVSIQEPELTVDLSNADFEANLTSYTGNQFRYDIQNPNVPDLEIVHWVSGQDMVLDNQGRDGYVIFRASAEEVAAFDKLRNPSNANNSLYLQIPNNLILDGLDTTRDLGNNLVPKKLNAMHDAGVTYVPAGAFSSFSVIRKTQKVVNGRIILKDTNNSTEDFISIKAEPKAFAN
ncbi:DUF4876 domain-containing protein [Faecalibacter macacae]|uniref:DUF4876 domain-containing protein n=1 Tax=Faecalibacter macacae TaxID=1859289 RepID=A0A3L9MCV5_9FLAO|nr:DUF4876 domain-containing protein [Faecalibacter macacae]RLZ09094.1 DUF4876 domain-containing protein [Faecalibacter macacae]